MLMTFALWDMVTSLSGRLKPHPLRREYLNPAHLLTRAANRAAIDRECKSTVVYRLGLGWLALDTACVKSDVFDHGVL